MPDSNKSLGETYKDIKDKIEDLNEREKVIEVEAFKLMEDGSITLNEYLTMRNIPCTSLRMKNFQSSYGKVDYMFLYDCKYAKLIEDYDLKTPCIIKNKRINTRDYC